MLQKKGREMLKLFISVTFGYVLKAVIDLPTEMQCAPCVCSTSHPVTVAIPCPQCLDCPPCTVPPKPTCPDILLISDDADASIQLKEPFKPKTQFEVIRYDYFNVSHIFNNFDGDPGIWQLGHQRSDINDAISQGVSLFNRATSANWRLNKLLSGYKRLDPLRGEEYHIDVQLATEVQSNIQRDQMQTIYKSYRFDIVKPFAKARLLSHQPYLTEKTINMIVPLTGFSDRFNRFIKNLIDIAWSRKGEKVCLIIVLVLDKNKEDDSVNEIKKQVAKVQKDYPRADIQIIETAGEGAFARGLTLDLGTRHLRNDSLIFFVDIDLLFSNAFLQRCRLNAVQGKRVFYPMMFSQYNPSYIRKYAPANAQNLMDINKYTGFWIYYGFGQACMYAEDYRRAGGFDLNIRGWGGEDVDLYWKFIKHNIQILNTADDELIHVYHDKYCNPNLPADQLDMCLGTASETLGYKQVLGKHILFSEWEAKKRNKTVF